MKSKVTSWKKWLVGLGIVILLLFVSGYIFLRLNTYEASQEANDLLKHESVSQDGDWITVTPDEIDGQIVFYQGGLVESAAYLPLAKMLSEEGYQVFIPEMPLNLAILDTDIIDEIIAANPSEKGWWLAGHSLGGASASIYTKENTEMIEGVIFLAAYPSDNSDLSDSGLGVLSIAGSLDGIINTEQYEETKALLPEDTLYNEIEGGNHSNFGSYGFQEGDSKSEMSREEQQEETVQVISDFLKNRSEVSD